MTQNETPADLFDLMVDYARRCHLDAVMPWFFTAVFFAWLVAMGGLINVLFGDPGGIGQGCCP